jgi:hypothetical protein
MFGNPIDREGTRRPTEAALLMMGLIEWITGKYASEDTGRLLLFSQSTDLECCSGGLRPVILSRKKTEFQMPTLLLTMPKLPLGND